MRTRIGTQGWARCKACDMSAVKHSIKRAMSCETLYQTSRVAGRRPHSLHDDSRVSLWAYLGVGCVVQICVAGLGDGLSGAGFGRVDHACCCFCKAPRRLKCCLKSSPASRCYTRSSAPVVCSQGLRILCASIDAQTSSDEDPCAEALYKPVM